MYCIDIRRLISCCRVAVMVLLMGNITGEDNDSSSSGGGAMVNAILALSYLKTGEGIDPSKRFL